MGLEDYKMSDLRAEIERRRVEGSKTPLSSMISIRTCVSYMVDLSKLMSRKEEEEVELYDIDIVRDCEWCSDYNDLEEITIYNDKIDLLNDRVSMEDVASAFDKNPSISIEDLVKYIHIELKQNGMDFYIVVENEEE